MKKVEPINLIEYNLVKLLNVIHTSFSFRNNSISELGPFIEFIIIDFAKDLELPGFPTRNSGILRLVHTTIINTFSRRAEFLAMFFPNFMLSNKTS